MEVLKTVDITWESISEYMAALDRRLGVNVGNLIGHTAVRHYVMGDESQGRAATPDEIEAMRQVVREGMTAGALGLSFNRNKGHFDPQGVNIPAVWANEDELMALAGVLAELGTGVIQSGAGRDPKTHELMTRLAVASGRQVVYNNLVKSSKEPEAWKEHIARVDETTRAGIRANPMCTPNIHTIRFTMHNTQVFRGVPTWHPIMLASDEEKLTQYRDPEVRSKLHQEVVEWTLGDIPDSTLGRNWYDTIWIGETRLAKNKPLQGKSIRELAALQGKGIIDALLDLVVEENLDTVFFRTSADNDLEAMTRILNYPNAYIGLSDAGAHVQFTSGYGYSSRLLGYWVREQGIMSLEQAVKRLTFEAASTFGIYDRGLLRPGLAADIVVFDPDTVNPLPEEEVHDLPAGAWRIKELARGVHYTIVNGRVLIENGSPTGELPGRVVRNALYHERVHA
jgi:N-acyl-D-aspartate/D-glutamate deacylase